MTKSQDLGIDGLAMAKVPRNEFETALLLSSILSCLEYRRYIDRIKYILSYSAKSPTDMICVSDDGKNILVEVELKLSNFLRHKHPIETVDYIICWKIDLDENRIHTMNEENCIFINGENRKYLTFNEKELEIIELEDVIRRIIKDLGI